MSAKQIRSGHQRRVLNWLIDGSGTVSHIAESLNLRMPHASLALRQLRERGEVSRDEQGSIRGAKHRLNEAGRARLAEDALARAQQHVRERPVQAEAIVLSLDGAHVLLGYVKPPRSRLLSLPNRGITEAEEVSPVSKGRQGGRWAVQRTGEIQWYTLSSFQTTEPPRQQALSGTLTDWTEEVDRIGLVHATLLDTRNEWLLSPGTWFSEPEVDASLPMALIQGEHVLGTATGTEHNITPQSGIHAHLIVAVNRSLAISALSTNALAFVDKAQQHSTRYLPINAIKHWMRARHTRMPEERLIEKYHEVRHHLLGDGGQTPPIALQRQLLADFGQTEWLEGNDIDTIHFSGVSLNGARSLLEWYVDESLRECAVEWPYSIEEALSILERLLATGRCRILITSDGEYQSLSTATTVIRSEKKLMKATIQLGRGKNIPLTLQQSSDERSAHAVHKRTPASAKELLMFWDASKGFDREGFSHSESDFERQKSMWRALSMYPQGDEQWANMNESTMPLASWIATPQQHRTSRWIRLRSILPTGWADLLPIENCETATLISALPKASPEWNLKALEKIRQRFTNNVESILKYQHFLHDDELGSWMATSILLAAGQMPEEFHELLEQACIRWLDAPHQTQSVLESLFPIGESLSAPLENCLTKCKAAAKLHPSDSTLYVWGMLLQHMESDEPMTPEFLRNAMKVLPSAWWRAWASEWLQVQLSSTSGRRWLAATVLPWPALLARPAGERGGFPAWPTTYPDGRIMLDEVLHILLLEDNLGKPALLDVYDMLATAERGEPVSYGRVHPLVGWLARPVDSWPSMGLDVLHQGDAEVGALLYARSFASKLE